MSTVDYPPLYYELVELLAVSAKPEQLLAYQLSVSTIHWDYLITHRIS